MAQEIKPENLINGVWRFDHPTSREEVVRLAEEWRDGPDGDRYQRIEVRRCGRRDAEDGFGIAFTYAYGGSAREYDRYLRKAREQLKSRFGAGRFHWDITSTLWPIK